MTPRNLTLCLCLLAIPALYGLETGGSTCLTRRAVVCERQYDALAHPQCYSLLLDIDHERHWVVVSAWTWLHVDVGQEVEVVEESGGLTGRVLSRSVVPPNTNSVRNSTKLVSSTADQRYKDVRPAAIQRESPSAIWSLARRARRYLIWAVDTLLSETAGEGAH